MTSRYTYSHDQRLSRVLGILSSHNLTVNEEKCNFAASAIEFVGFRLTSDSLSPLQSDVDAVLRLPEPPCPAQLSSFLGMTAYYLRFLPHYSETTAARSPQEGRILVLDPSVLCRCPPAKIPTHFPASSRPF